MFLAGAVAAAASLVAIGPASATATTLLFHDTAAGTSLTVSDDDGSVPFTTPFIPDKSDVFASFNQFVVGSFTISTTISILDPGTSLVSDELEFSSLDFNNGTSRTNTFFMSNDGPPLPLDVFNPIFETGLLQTLLTAQDEQGNSFTVQFLSDRETPSVTNNSVPEPSTLALFGAALAAMGMMMRRRTARFRA